MHGSILKFGLSKKLLTILGGHEYPVLNNTALTRFLTSEVASFEAKLIATKHMQSIFTFRENIFDAN